MAEVRGLYVAEANPIKQGLKLSFIVFFPLCVHAVAEANPIKQGLKRHEDNRGHKRDNSRRG